MIQTVNREQYVLNFFREKRVGDKILLTTDQGGWIILSQGDYFKMLRGDVGDGLYEALSQNGILLTEANIQSIISKTADRLFPLFSGVGLHLVVPTTRCNQRCIYCHANASPPSLKMETLDQAVADKIVNFIFQSPSPKITIEFQGGESLMAFEGVKYVVKRALEINTIKQKRLSFDIVTNLTLLTDEMIAFISEHGIRVSTSLDGPQYVHDANRRFFDGGETYNTVVSMIEKLKQKNIPVGMIMVATRHSLPYWKDIVDEYLRLGQSNICLKPLNYLGFARDSWDQIGYTSEEYLDFWKKSTDYIFELNRKGVLITESNVMLILSKLYSKTSPNHLDLRSPCGMIIGQAAYNYNGDIFCCDEGRTDNYHIIGNVMNHSYRELIESEKTMELISASITENYLCDACVYKPFCGVCPVLSRAEGRLLPSPPVDNHCKVFKYMFNYVITKITEEPKALKRLYVGLMLDRQLNTAVQRTNPGG